jgi:NAD(P)-dependent dehydrogenase (short-subunit alcohol dehydrogenase family)
VDPAIEKLLCDSLADGLFNTLEQALDHSIDTATAYVLAKRGVMRLTERPATPWGAKGGRVVAISPGLIDTAMGRLELERQPIIPQTVEPTPVKRSGSPLAGRTDDIAALVAFLESDAAAFISGCDIRVAGGLVGAARDMLGGG